MNIKEHEHQTYIKQKKKKKKNHQIKEHEQEQTQENPHKTTPKPNQTKLSSFLTSLKGSNTTPIRAHKLQFIQTFTLGDINNQAKMKHKILT